MLYNSKWQPQKCELHHKIQVLAKAKIRRIPMQKKLLAAAVAASIGIPGAGMAQGPTLYGQANLSLDYLGNDDEDGLQASSNTSRFGVKGSYDLGGGLSAIYLFEWGVYVANGTSNGEGINPNPGTGLSRRDQYAGFKHDIYGTLVVGRHDTPGKLVGRKADLFWSEQLGTNRSFTDILDGSGQGAGFDLRADNVVGYISPNWGPVHIFGAYITDDQIRTAQATGTEVTTNAGPLFQNKDFDAYSIAGLYEQKSLLSGNDGLYVGVSYEQHNIKFDPNAPAQGLKDSEAAWRVAGTYDLANWEFALFYQFGKDQGFIDGADRNQVGGGLAYTVGPNTFKGQLYWLDDLDDTGTDGLGSGKDTGGFLYAIGWDHAFSKNVQFYVQGAALSADKRAGVIDADSGLRGGAPQLVLGGSGHGASVLATPDKTTWGVSVGTRVKF
jgi:predicted porin